MKGPDIIMEKNILFAACLLILFCISGCNGMPNIKKATVQSSIICSPTPEPSNISKTESYSLNNTPMYIDQLGDATEIVQNYIEGLPYAIENNDFPIGHSLPSSSKLYYSQKKMISDAYKKGIKEKIPKFGVDIKEVRYVKEIINSTKRRYICDVYASEKVEIKYPGGEDYQTVERNWVYTVELIYYDYDQIEPDMKIVDIEKWDANTQKRGTIIYP